MALAPADTIALFALGTSVVAAAAAIASAFIARASAKSADRSSEAALREAKRADSDALAMFQRQNVIELHNAWANVNSIDPRSLIGPDVVKAANALQLTSALWNFDVVHRAILFDSYWEPFKELYDTLNACNDAPPGHKKACRAFLSPAMTRAYDGMRKMEVDHAPHEGLGSR